MAKRQLARKTEERPARKLRLVPPPKKKRRPRRSWKIGRIWKRRYEDRHELHTYENELILTALRAYGGSSSATGLGKVEPGRWNTGELGAAMTRMRREGLLTSSGGTGWMRGKTYIVYTIPPPPDIEQKG